MSIQLAIRTLAALAAAASLLGAPAPAAAAKCTLKTDMRATVTLVNPGSVPSSFPASAIKPRFRPRDDSSVFHTRAFSQFVIQGCRIASKNDYSCTHAIVLNLSFNPGPGANPTLKCSDGNARVWYEASSTGTMNDLHFEPVECEVQITKVRGSGKKIEGTFSAVVMDSQGVQLEIKDACFKSREMR